MARVSWSGLPGSTSSPALPSARTAGTSPTRVATIGRAVNMASRSARGRPSLCEGSTNTSADARRLPMSPRKPSR